MHYYVDFENVGTAGLAGIEQLTENDCVRIYYSNNPNVNMETVIQIKKSVAKIQFLKLYDSLKKMNISNALDIVIVTDISNTLSELSDCFCSVISNDKGYDNVIVELNGKNKNKTVFRAATIAEAMKKCEVSNSTSANDSVIDETALENLFKNELLGYQSKKSQIIQIVKSSKSRVEVNNNIGKFLSGVDQKEIMKQLKPIIKNLPGNA